jgi:hypothetical protein
MKSQFLAFLSFAVALSADAATVHKAPLKGLLIDNASVVTNVTGTDAAKRLESESGGRWIDASGDVYGLQTKASFNGVSAVSTDDPVGTVDWFFAYPGMDLCDMHYDGSQWSLQMMRVEDVEDPDGNIIQEEVVYTYLGTAPWGSPSVALKREHYNETIAVSLSYSTGVVNRVVFTNDLPKVDVSGASSSVKLQAVTPEVADTTVTLRPVDGAANHVTGKVEIAERRGFTGEFTLTTGFYVTAEMPAYDDWFESINFDSITLTQADATVDIGKYVNDEWTTEQLINITLTRDVTIIREGEPFATLHAGCTLYCQSADAASDVSNNATIYLGQYMECDQSSFTLHGEWAERLEWVELCVYEGTITRTRGDVAAKSPVVAIPESTDATKARRFSLAIETDTESEKAVTWQGGEVIEALPGASKLVPGLNVWDVAEVAPGKFKVEGSAGMEQIKRLPTHETVTNVARSVVNSVWDAALGVAWEARMHNGHLYYIAVTNKPPEVK